MPWSRQLIPGILRHVAPSLSRSCAVTGPVVFLGSARYMSSPGGFDVKDIFGKALSLPGNKSPADMWADKSKNLKLPPPPDTWTGRRLVVRNGELQNAFQQLNLRLRQNNVAREIALTVRHEKKGDKRARLRSERWRKRFADAVRKKVQLVGTIRRRGG